MKTPLAALQLYADQLMLRARNGDSVTATVEKLKGQCTRLARLIDSLLDLARIRAGRIQLELGRVDLVAIVKEVIARNQEAIRHSGSSVELTHPDSVVGHWDGERIDQIATNLLANAIKYGKGNPIEISVAASEEKATLVVEDHGIGIHPLDQKRIFEPFERAVSGRNYGGLGLGLWIVRQLVEGHQGSMQLSSNPDRGSRFSVELPMGASRSPRPSVSSA